MARQIWSKLLHGMPVVCEAWLIEQSLYQNQTYVSVGGGGGGGYGSVFDSRGRC